MHLFVRLFLNIYCNLVYCERIYVFTIYVFTFSESKSKSNGLVIRTHRLKFIGLVIRAPRLKFIEIFDYAENLCV